MQHTVAQQFKPHGICAGSEHQGGQHEASWAPVQAAVNYATTMTVDGQNRDLVNYWQRLGVCAGDRLLLRLVLANTGTTGALLAPRTREFQLTAYYEGPVSATVTSAQSYWQLEAHVLHADNEVAAGGRDHRLTGYWHIAQSFQGRRGCDVRGAQGRGAPLQVTFAPVWVRGDEPGGPAETEALCAQALRECEPARLQQALLAALGPEDPEEDMHELLRASGVSLRTLRRLFIGGPVEWVQTADAPRLLPGFVLAWHRAGREGRAGLQRRIARWMVAFDKVHETFDGATNDAKQAAVRAFFRDMLGSDYEAYDADMNAPAAAAARAAANAAARLVYEANVAAAGRALPPGGRGPLLRDGRLFADAGAAFALAVGGSAPAPKRRKNAALLVAADVAAAIDGAGAADVGAAIDAAGGA